MPAKGRLAKVANPEALAASEGPHARIEIVVPSAWLEEGARLQIKPPKLVPCDRCDGGGCDSCDRSGGFRIENRSPIDVTVPAGAPSGVVIRLPSPFDTLDLVLIRINGGRAASSGVTRIGRAQTRALAPRAEGFNLPALVVVGVILLGALILLIR